MLELDNACQTQGTYFYFKYSCKKDCKWGICIPDPGCELAKEAMVAFFDARPTLFPGQSC